MTMTTVDSLAGVHAAFWPEPLGCLLLLPLAAAAHVETFSDAN